MSLNFVDPTPATVLTSCRFLALGAIAVELFLGRKIYRERHTPFPADPEYPKDETGTATSTPRKGIFSRLFSKRRAPVVQKMEQDNILPEHATPNDLVANPRSDSPAPSENVGQIGAAHQDAEPQRYELYSGQPQQQPYTYAGYQGYANHQPYDTVDDVYEQVSPQSPQQYTLQETYAGFDHSAQSYNASNPYGGHTTGGYQPAPDYRYEDGIYSHR